jgi:hypothetical protein
MSLSALKDPGVWSAVVALLALVLSQLPPIRELLTPSRVRLSLPDRVMLTHFLGNIHIMSLVTVENLGSRKQTVARLEGLLIGSTGDSRHLPAQQYVFRSQPISGQPMPELLMAGIHLKRDEVWSESVRFFSPPSEEEEDRINDLVGRMEKSIRGQIQQAPPGRQTPFEAEPSIVADAMTMFKDKFRLPKGNYTFLLAAISESGEILDVQGSELTIYESAIQTLRNATEDYKFGGGIYIGTQSQSAAYPRLRSMSNVQARTLFEKRFSA